MSHANAALTPRARLRLARLIVERRLDLRRRGEDVHGLARAPRASGPTGTAPRAPAGMTDRSSRPHHCPNKTPAQLVRQIVGLRWRHRLGPVQIAGRLGVPASTVHAVLVRCRINRLSRIDRVTGEPIRRYEHDHPGSLIHVDVTKFGNIPDGGGHRFVGTAQGNRNASARRRTGPRGEQYRSPGPAPLPAHRHRRPLPARLRRDLRRRKRRHRHRRPAPRRRLVRRPRRHRRTGPVRQRLCYRSHAWRDACTELGITHKRTRPYRPQTNGKIERFHRTLADGWAYARFYTSETERRHALPGWLHFYNHHRAHSAIGGQPPVTRLTNLPGHHT